MMEAALEMLVESIPNEPEVWYDLAVLKATLNKPAEAAEAMRRALDLSNRRLQIDPKAPDLSIYLRNDSRFVPFRNMPEFQQLFAPK